MPRPSFLPASPIAFALDFPDLTAARAAAEEVRAQVGMLKVGLEMFTATGGSAVQLGHDLGLPVFLDLKLHDIPETVERAVGRAAEFGARLLTVHAAGGTAMLERAVARAQKDGQLHIVAVTVLTSLDVGDLRAMGINDDPAAQAVRLAKLAWNAGVRFFVSSPAEVATMRAALGPEAVLVTPGIRPGEASATVSLTGTAKDDQKRVATAYQAIRDGADILVVGRPIRDARNRAHAAEALTREAELAFNERNTAQASVAAAASTGGRRI